MLETLMGQTSWFCSSSQSSWCHLQQAVCTQLCVIETQDQEIETERTEDKDRDRERELEKQIQRQR